MNFELLVFPRDERRLRQFLMSEKWTFHVNPQLSAEQISKMIADGVFGGSSSRSFIVSHSGSDIGFVRVFDLDDIEDDGFPMFDLRISSAARGQGFGKQALAWLSNYLFSEFPQLDRIVGATRSDNTPMRKTFKANGYLKEGHFRRDWVAADGRLLDTVRYSLLRQDWETGRLTPVAWDDGP